MHARALLFAILLGAGLRAAPLAADRPPHDHPADRGALQQAVARNPENAVAWHDLGLLWRETNDTAGLEKAVECLQHATELEPENARYLADYGGTAMELASRTRSISVATNGRAAMEKAVALNPDDLDAREGLFQYYNQAPFFVGGSARKAAEELEEIRRRAPDRALVLEVISKTAEKDFAGAFAICEGILARKPNDYAALYQYGRASSLSGLNLPRGLASLQKALTLAPPSPAAPRHTHVWYRIGDIELKLGATAEAKHAFQESLKLDPGNRLAAAALQRMH